ncbi:MAG: ABC transporter ATP-binding protein [Polyangiaceae bacterium]|jgi:multiple sugar transport system ATP-binding protein|nr:ABC transporter ATP-binding protein [Polyangiaceae bacterium]
MSVPLHFEHVGKRFGETIVLSDVHFSTEPGELVVLVGPSGCGKSTLMRLVAGLETLSEGTIRAGDRVLDHVPPQDRGVGMVFQSYALYPHLTVRDNLAFPLFVKKVAPDVTAKEVQRVAEMLSLVPLLDRLPKQLSGGQRQRVAIGRCLVRKPDIYCFDEPLSNLDAALRSQIRVELKALQRELGKTTIYVTHDQVEAMTMADRIVVLHKGVVQQVGPPEELYLRPNNRFVARFIGTPAMNLIAGTIDANRFIGGSIGAAVAAPREGKVLLGVRPEHVLVRAAGRFEGTVRGIEPVGEAGYLHLAVDGLEVDTSAAGTSSEPTKKGLLCASVPGRDAFAHREGDVVRFDLAEDRLVLFDPDGGERLG